MPFTLSKLTNWGPDGYVNTEIGRLAVFGLTTSAQERLRSEAKSTESGKAFARLFTQHSCFPADALRDGKYRPNEILITEDDAARLSDESLKAIAMLATQKMSGSSTETNNQSAEDELTKLMIRFQKQWEEADRGLADAIKKITGHQDRFGSIEAQIERLPIAPIDLHTFGSTSDRTLPEIRNILLEMNQQARTSSDEAARQAKITRTQNHVVIWITAAGLLVALASLGVSLFSRLTCSIVSEQTFLRSHPILSQSIAVACGFEGRSAKENASPSHSK